MGFIKESNINNQVDLTAYLTQEARKNILDGSREDFQISYFSLSDSDTNYFTSKEIVNSKNNILPSGMVPDITGDYNGVIKSIAGGTLNPKYFLSGSTTNKVGIPGTSGVIGDPIVNVDFDSGNATFNDVYPTLTNVSKSFSTIINTTINSINIDIIKNTKYSLSLGNIRLLQVGQGYVTTMNPFLNDVERLINNSLYFYDINRGVRSKDIIIYGDLNNRAVSTTTVIDTELRADFPLRDTSFNYRNITSGDTITYIRFSVTIQLRSQSNISIGTNSRTFIFTISNNILTLQNNFQGNSLSQNARIIVNNLVLPEPINLTNIIALKQVEKNEDGTLGFQKTQTRQGTTTVNGSNLRFTKINLDNVLNPNANLAMSFNIPITTPQISSYLSRFNNTALQSLIQPTANTSTYNNQFILVEIPQNTYGELIDGKTIELNIPVKSGSTAVNYSLYSTYFRSNIVPNTLNYNTLLSDPNPFSSYFSDVNPSLTNDYNSNISYLFSNNINKPLSTSLVVGDSLFSGTTRLSSNDSSISLNNRLNSNTLIQVKISFSSTTNQNITDLLCIKNDSDFIIEGQTKTTRITIMEQGATQEEDTITPINGYYFSIPTSGNDLILNVRSLREIVNFQNLIILNSNGDPYNTGLYYFNITINYLNSVTSESTWNKFTNVNKFSTNPLNNSGNKKWAKFDGGLLDKPVGIAFLDKGFLLITEPAVVNNFNYTGATSSGYDNIVSGITYSGTSDFTRVYFSNTNTANINFDSITTEYTQNILCLALNNEFITTTNPTYQLAYQDETVKPLYFTQINLHNKYGKIVGIAKTSEPIKRTLSSVNIFNIKLKL
jgi:hypothetical protein